ncbi:sensor histidine kinase [Bacterioplanes sanyensis]|uniref:sensor histidine kinase n=1 Tax=Bacterioplanes sanyensis TaxID=1249553 RepID=UPI0012FD68C9|nr:histidine kinase [Bacterioplanes sanyensis]
MKPLSPVDSSPSKAELDAFFLPDLCNTRAVILLLGVTEALVLALTLVETGLEHFSLQRFSLVSFFALWVALLSVALLCQLRRLMARRSVALASTAAMLVTQLVTLVVSLGSEWFWPLNQSPTDWLWVLRNQLIAAIFAAMALRYFYVQSQWRQQAQAELRSRLAVLQANIRPHFFFNTLNTVASLIVVDPDKAEQMLVDLARLFRAVLKADDRLVPLATELQLGRGYLDIEQVRLGERMKLYWPEHDELPDIQVPQLLLQPLLENAVYHGVQPRRQGGEIRVTVHSRTDSCRIVIDNSCPEKPVASEGNRMAQNNIRARLQAVYDGEAQLQAEHLGSHYRTTLILPRKAT